MLPIKIELPEGFLNPEKRCDYVVSSEKKKIWAIELDLLNQIDLICKKHKIRYFACAGTMLGAVRHCGFIPWDDDIDIMMMRSDYEQLCHYQDEFKEPYFFQTEYNDRGSLRGHAQLRNSQTTAILKYEQPGKFRFNQGIFIDIFPLDSLPDGERERERFIKKIENAHRKAVFFRDVPAQLHTSEEKWKNALKTRASRVLKIFNEVTNAELYLYAKYERMMRIYNDCSYSDVCIMVLLESGRRRFIWKRDDIESGVIIKPFEFMNIPVPLNYEKILEKSYGDWRKLIKAETEHGSTLFDTSNSYIKYI